MVDPSPAHPAAPVRVAAGCVFFNASDIIQSTLANLVAQGVGDLYIVDHLSDAAILPTLQKAFGDRVRITALTKDTRPFYQGAMMTLLMNMARRDGVDIFLPIDSDEFPDCDDPASDLLSEFARWFTTESTETLHLPVVNYLQFRDVEVFDPARLGEITARLLPNGRPGAPGRAPAGQRHHLERAAVVKTAVRLTGLADPDRVRLGEGSHRAFRGPTEDHELSASAAAHLVVRHLPVRSRSSLSVRKEHFERRRLMGRAADNRTAVLNDEQVSFGDSWKLASLPRSGQDPQIDARLRVVHDTAFRAIAERIRHMDLGSPTSGASNGASTTPSPADIFTVASDSLGAVLSPNGLSQPLRSAPTAATPTSQSAPPLGPDESGPRRRRIIEALARAEDAERKLAQMQASRSWRMTAPLRAIGRVVRGGRNASSAAETHDGR